MNRHLILTIAAIAAISMSLYNCAGKKTDDELSHHHHSHGEAAHDHSNHHHHDHDADHDEDYEKEEDAIVIEPEQAEKLGIEVTKINMQPFTEAIKVTGEVVAPPSARRVITATAPGIVQLSASLSTGRNISAGERIAVISGREMAGGDVAESYRINYEAAKRELDRLKPLHEKGIVSTLEYNKALTEFEKAKAMLGSASGKDKGSTTINAAKGGTVSAIYVNNGDYVEAGQPIAAIGDNARLTFRADVPRRYHAKIPMITDAIIETSCDDCESFALSDYNGKKLDGESGVTGSKNGFLPVYFSFNNPGTIDGNGYVESFLQLSTNHQALSVPQSSLSEQQNQWFVYVRLDEDCYEKRPVTIGGRNGSSVEIKAGLNEGEEVVTEGVVFVKLAENAGIVPEGHTHNH